MYDINITVAPLKLPALSKEDQRLLQETLQHPYPNEETAGPQVSDYYKGKTVYLGRPLAEARSFLQLLKSAGATAGLIPMRYRRPPINQEAAWRAATEFLGFVRNLRAREYGELGPGLQTQLWWWFSAADSEAFAARYAPGAVIIRVDSFDGHIGTDGELAAWGRFNDGLPPYAPGFIIDDILIAADKINTANAGVGAKLSDVPPVLATSGLPGAVYQEHLTSLELTALVDRGRPAIVLVHHPSGQWHTVVVDSIHDGRVAIRDSWPPHMGSTYSLPLQNFALSWTGAAVVFPAT